ncbi:MAG: STAS domain-containing protein [Clostridia bacterium]|nr:STAS domain-containing protein [Clostridia bacterium]
MFRFIINGPFAAEEAAYFRKEAYRFLENDSKKILVDFSNCNFIDSTGLGMLVSVYKKCAEKNAKLVIASIKDEKVFKVFQLTRLDKVFEFCESC